MTSEPKPLSIWKYTLKVTDFQPVSMPVGAEILSCQVQGGVLCLWALVDPLRPSRPRHISIYGTGHPISRKQQLRHIDTFQLHGGSLVFHVFEDLAR